MKAVSVINFKGGVGKTTITANLAAELANRGKKVLAIDLDPQTNLTFSFLKPSEWREKYEDKTIKDWFDPIIPSPFTKKEKPTLKSLIIKADGIDLISSNINLLDIDVKLAPMLAESNDHYGKAKRFLYTYSLIRKESEQLKNDYDIILFDCPPNFSIVTKNAIAASDYYVIPTKMDYLSTLGIKQLKNEIDKFTGDYNKCCEEERGSIPINPANLGVIATMISLPTGKPLAELQHYINEVTDEGFTVFDNKIRENKKMYSDAGRNSPPVVLQTQSGSTYVEVIKELKNLTTEFTKKVGGI